MTILVAAAVVRDGPGEPVLLTRRPEGTHLAGYWELPGGKVEPGEDPEHAVVRECREELGVELEVRDILEVVWHAYRDKAVLLLFYDCRWIGGTLEHLGVADHAWVEPGVLGTYELPPPDARLVAKLRAGR
ncbi:MAG TPA: (deoxy)nucleoside triphosphate pyrophosphohydrolase [Sandaracinaceae bacterium LLY-WYZ-13_1]|nr:(deoxy)nucleoside triphosphate pyrophosphohydrolase [Sandaracinaceae bacterium LLY-WYZ-13_1]